MGNYSSMLEEARAAEYDAIAMSYGRSIALSFEWDAYTKPDVLSAFGVAVEAEGGFVPMGKVGSLIGDVAVVIAKSPRKVWVDQANGDNLVAIVRNGRIVTFALTRSSQLRPDHLRVQAVRYAC